MACACLLLWAVAPLTAISEATFTLRGENTACRASTDSDDDCSETTTVNCTQNYDVLTTFWLEKCKVVCGHLMKYCHGIEFRGDRCEIWKVPILRTSESSNNQCYDHDDQSDYGEDGKLSLLFEAELGGVDVVAFSQLLTNATYEPWKMDLETKVGADLLALYDQKDNWTVRKDDIQVMVKGGSDDPPRIRVTVTPSTPIDALKLYAYLRTGSDFKDGTEPGGEAAVQSTMETAMQKSGDAFAFLATGDAITVTIMSRVLEKAVMKSPSPPPSDRSTDGTASTRGWSAAALFLMSWVASSWRGEAC